MNCLLIGFLDIFIDYLLHVHWVFYLSYIEPSPVEMRYSIIFFCFLVLLHLENHCFFSLQIPVLKLVAQTGCLNKNFGCLNGKWFSRKTGQLLILQTAFFAKINCVNTPECSLSGHWSSLFVALMFSWPAHLVRINLVPTLLTWFKPVPEKDSHSLSQLQT